MNKNQYFFVNLIICFTLVGVLGCTVGRDPTVPAGASEDSKVVSAQKTIAVALNTTLTPEATATATSLPTATPTQGPDVPATETAEEQRIATRVAATQMALPTAAPTATPTWTPLPTPDSGATDEARAGQMATAVAATLTAQPTNTPTPTPTQDFAATQTADANRLATAVAATLTAQPMAPSTNTPIPSPKVLAQRPNEQELQGVSSLWSLTTFQDLSSPGTQTYNVSITADQNWSWGFAWCAIDSERLQAILQPLTVNMLVDDMVLADALVLQHQGTTSAGDHCYYWSTVLTNWQPGAVVKLDISYFLTNAIDDGRQNYASGQYHQLMRVYVR